MNYQAYLNGPKRKRKSSCGRWYDFIAYVANWDEENKAIFKLAAPLTVSSLSYAIFDAISTALISRYLGSEVLSAYIVTNLLIGLSDTFINGVGDALGAVCSHAIGMGNYKLAGQYVQIGAIVYGVFAIPCMGIWWFKVRGSCFVVPMKCVELPLNVNYSSPLSSVVLERWATVSNYLD